MPVQVSEEKSLRRLARRSADALRSRDLFGEKRLHIPTLLKSLGLRSRADDDMPFRGIQSSDQISLQPGHTHINTRFVVLHEIGHAVLARDHPSLLKQLSDAEHEEFASHFAVSMLLSEEQREVFARVFRELDSPAKLARTAQEFGFSIAMFLQVAVWDGAALENSDNIWLRVKHAPNRFTLRDPKLRVVAAYCDPTRWYVPPNKGFDGICLDGAWLADIHIGRESSRNDVALRMQKVTVRVGRANKYAWVSRTARVAAMALRPARREQGPYFLVLISSQTSASIPMTSGET